MIGLRNGGLVGILGAVLLLAWPTAGRGQTNGPDGPLDVDEAVRIALRQNYAFKQTEAQLSGASGDRLNAIAGLLPRFGGSYTYNKSSRTSTLFDFPVRQSVLTGDALTVADLELTDETTSDVLGFNAREDLSLSLWYQYRSSQAGVQGARHAREAASQQLAFDVRQQFYLVLRAQDLLGVQEEDLRLARDEERRINSMFDLGSVAKVDVLKARVRVADAEVALIRQKNQVAIETSRLATLLGFRANTPLELAGDLGVVPGVIDSARAAEESRVRPDLLQAKESLRSASNLYKASILAWVPGLFASFNAGQTVGSSASDQIRSAPDPADTNAVLLFPTLQDTDIDTENWSVQVGASLNLDAFINMGQNKRARANQKNAEYVLDGLQLAVQQELEEAILNYRASVSAIDAAERGVESAEEDLRLSQERYQQGLGTVLELLEAQVNLTRARNAFVNALTSLKISEAALDKARGTPIPY